MGRQPVRSAPGGGLRTCDPHPDLSFIVFLCLFVILIEGIKAILRNERSLEVVGEARDGRQAVDLVKELQPDLLLMDVSMPDT